MCLSDTHNATFPRRILSHSHPHHLNDLISQPESAFPGCEAARSYVVNEDLRVSLLVLVLVTQGEAEHLPRITQSPLQLNLLKITISVIIVLRFT